MIWIVVALAVVGVLWLLNYRQSQRGNLGKVIDYSKTIKKPEKQGNLGKVIDYSKTGKSPRREAWVNYSASEAELVRRVGEKTAERLIVNILLDNPSQSRKWCAEKALFDLERDQ